MLSVRDVWEQLRADVPYFNPGSAGPRRFKLLIAVGKLRIQEGKIKPEIVILSS
jgi:hypothetical protein